MNELPNRAKQIMKEKRMTLIRLAEITGINKGNLSRYLSGEREPRQKAIHTIAKALNVDEAWLMGMTDVRRAEQLQAENRKRTTLIPVYSALSCGTGTWVDEIPDDYVSVPESMRFSGRAFANFADGDSMTPKIRNGDLLIFQETPQIPSGSVGSFSLNGAYYCKRLKHLPDGSYWLFSDNPEYDPIPITKNDDFRVLGLYKLKISKEQ